MSGCFLFSEFAFPASSALEEDVSRGMVRIAAGAFTSGSEKFNDEKPEKDIYLDSFLIDKFEVTQKEFTNIMKKNPSEFKGDNLPVDRVNWYEARDYCGAIDKHLALCPFQKAAAFFRKYGSHRVVICNYSDDVVYAGGHPCQV